MSDVEYVFKIKGAIFGYESRQGGMPVLPTTDFDVSQAYKQGSPEISYVLMPYSQFGHEPGGPPLTLIRYRYIGIYRLETCSTPS